MWTPRERFEVGSVLADALLAGSWDEEGLLERSAIVLTFGPRPDWLRELVRRALSADRERPADRPREFHAWAREELDSIESESEPPAIAGRLFPALAMGRMRWPVPRSRPCPSWPRS